MNLSRLQKNFEALAAEDPLWTVLSDNSKRGGKWDPEEFYQTGEEEIADLEKRLSVLNIPLRGDEALDFGCGVGRLSFPLSRRFARCVGVDISESMIRHAEKNVGRGNACSFILNTRDDLSCFVSGRFAFAYSDIVFQHMAPRYAQRYFTEIARVLQPGGHFAFQLPSHLDFNAPQNAKPLRLLRKRLHYALQGLRQRFGSKTAYFEMNAIRQDRLIRFMETRTGLQLVALWDHPGAGDTWRSYLYVFRKP